MSREYPDVLGDLVDARQRLEINGVQYVAALRPAALAPGQVTTVRVWLQSCWDVPVTAAITLSLPPHAAPLLSIVQPRTDVPLEAAEVGEVAIPVAVAPAAPAGEYPLALTLGAAYEERGLYVRSEKNEGRMGSPPLAFTTGMALSACVGLGFTTRTCADQVLRLRVEGAPEPAPAADLTPTFLSHWTVAELPVEGKAQQYVNDQRLYLLPKLTRQALYVAFMDESQARFRQAGLPLQVGEAVFVAKILTFAAEYFLSRPDLQDGVLVPAYRLAFRYNLPVGDPITLIARADYARLVRLAASFTFGLLRQQVGRDYWSAEEQAAVTDLIAGCLESGATLPAEFLYLPLVLGGLLVGSQVMMPGEVLAQSLGLLARARQQRSAELAENPELNSLLDRLLKQA